MNEIQKIWSLLEEINDPEVPVLSIVDLGIVREVNIDAGGPEIIITPTYSGCPAMDLIKMNINASLLQHGYNNFKISIALSPAWTTDWMTEKGKEKLKAFGVAPPLHKQQVCHPELFQEEEAVPCPLCNSYNTRLISRFGSTPCKALYRCNDCHEPFDYFKCH